MFRTLGLSLGLLLLLTVSVGTADPAKPVMDAEELARGWNALWPKLAENYQLAAGRYCRVRNWAEDHLSSLGQTPEQLRRTFQVVVAEKNISGSSINHKLEISSPTQDIQAAANALPKLAPGEFGKIYSYVVRDVQPDGGVVIGSICLQAGDALTKARQKAHQDIKTLKTKTTGKIVTADQDLVDFMIHYRAQLAEREKDFAATELQIVLLGNTNKSAKGTIVTGPLGVVVAYQDGNKLLLCPTASMSHATTETDIQRMLKDRQLTPQDVVKTYRERLAQGVPGDNALQAVCKLIDDKASLAPVIPTDAPVKPAKPTRPVPTGRKAPEL